MDFAHEWPLKAASKFFLDAAQRVGLGFERRIEMPANNLMLVLRR